MAQEADTLELPDELSSVNRPSGDADIMSGMAENLGRKIGSQHAVFGETERRIEEDRGRMTAAMAASGREVEKLQPWNHDEEARKRTADPLETFGSLGSVFGILASAFTRAPMENALNASAAAMTAVKAANEDDYKKAYTSWKDNMALVEKRHNMIQAQFNDAQALFRTDMAAGTVKAQNIATRFGDEQSLFLLENGMNKEFFELQAQRAKAMEGISEANRKIDENTFRRKTFENIIGELPEEKRNDPMTQMRAWNYAHGLSSRTEEDVMMRWWADHPGASAEDAAKFAAKYKADQKAAEGFSTPDRQDAKEIERRRDQYVSEGMKPNEAYDKASTEVRKIASANKLNVDRAFMEKYYEENPDATAEEFSKAFQEFKKGQKAPGTAGGNANLTPDRIRAQAIAEYRDKLKASVDPETGESYSAEKIGEMVAKYDKKLKTESAAPSGNKIIDIQKSINQVGYFEDHMNAADQLLLKHNAITGLGGKLTRPAEVINNIFGGNESDRAQFRREVLGMQELASRILTGSAGRPLAAEASKVEGIIAGLAAGDTKTNTLRAYEELRPLIKKIKQDLETLKGGGAAYPASGGQAPLPAGGKWWEKDKRSDAGVNDNVAQRGNISDEIETGREVIDIPPGRNPRDYIPKRRVSETMSDESDYPVSGGQQYAEARPRTYTSQEQVRSGTEYAAGSIEWYLQNYGPDVRKWPYKRRPDNRVRAE